MNSDKIRSLLKADETRHETLSVLCELAGLGVGETWAACVELVVEESDTLTRAALRGVACGAGEGAARELTMRVEEALNYVEQLEALLTDMALSLPLRRDLSDPERLRREGLIEGGRAWARRAREGRDDRVLAILAEGSRRLGNLVLTSPERWFDEGVGQLLGDLSGLAGAVRVEAERLDVEDVVSASRYPGLLAALWRGVEGREARWSDQVCRQHLEGRVSGEALEMAMDVARRVVSSERRQVEGVEFEMMYCPPGEFWMGSQDGVGHDDEHPHHRVQLTRGFLIGQTQVTQALWEAVMGSNPSRFKGASLPVENISWYDAVRFCNALSGLDNLQPVYEIGTGDQPTVSLDPTANGYRLPTEAQWEYAAKAGTELKYAGSADLKKVGWFGGLFRGEGTVTDHKTHPVARKAPNAWGIYDMSGNVWEWCADQYDHDAYKSRSGTVTDPAVYAAGLSSRVLRGGGWWFHADSCRVASRYWGVTDDCGLALGVRLLRCNLN